MRAFFAWALVVFFTFWTLPSQAATTTLTPTADAYVQNGANAAVNYGTATTLRIQASATAASNYESHLKFDTTSVSGVISNAKLRIYAKLTATGTITTSAYGVPTTTWGETTLTWNNKPAVGASLGSVVVNSTTYAYKDIDVTAYVQSEFAANRKVMSFAYRSGANTTPYVTAYSKNSTSANKPQLVITYATNAAPTVSVSSPTAGASYIAPASVNLTATAMDSDGSISKVEYYNGATLIATGATTDPYAATWSNVAAGSYSITAKATDNLGAVTTSGAVSITVSAANTPPSSTLTSPTNGATYTAPASINLTANATDVGGSVSKVEYYNGATLIATSIGPSPFAATWSNVAAGTYSITAKATDNQGAATSSSPVSISVNAPNTPPTVSLTAPSNGATYSAPANITLSATATDSDGSISKVEYYNGAILIVTSTGPSPFAATWSNVAAGNYNLTAKATDNQGATTTSSSVSVTVAANNPPSVSITSPSTGINFNAPANISFTADATDTEGSISKVEYYSGATLVASSNGPTPFAATWNNVSAGNYSITAKATDNQNAVTTSSAISVNVNVPIIFNYSYDELGRLVGTSDGSGNAAQYVYDPVGNITAIKRLSASTTSIIDFTPDAGGPGTEVVISGTGFSATPNLNTVKFNGATATILSATTTRLEVSTPTGVTSGPVSVTSPTGSAISSTNFIVGGGANVPTITSFSPLFGAVGTVVNVTGTNIDTGVARTKVRFNQTTVADVSNVTTTSLTTVVPSNVSSGKIRVITPNGFADSVVSFTVPPATISTTNIVDSKNIAIGGTQTLNITPANKVGLLLIEGGANPYRSLNITSLTTAPAASIVAYEVYSPQGILIVSGSFRDTVSIHLPALTQSATYAVYFKPGNATANITVALAANRVVAADTAPVLGNIAIPYQSVRFTFEGQTGQNLGLGFTGLTLSPTASSIADIKVYRPDGILMTNTSCATAATSLGGCGFNLNNISQTGIYAVIVTPSQGGAGSFSVILSTDLTGTLEVGSPPRVFSSTRVGQNGVFTFLAPAGQVMLLSLSESTIPTGTITVRAPDNTVLHSGVSLANPTTLSWPPVEGVYKILLDPTGASTGKVTLQLIPRTEVTALTVNNASPTQITMAPGQSARYTFAASAGTSYALVATGISTQPAGGVLEVSILDPNGVLVPGCGMGFKDSIDSICDTTVFATPGIYTVLINQPGMTASSLALSVKSEITGTVTISSGAVTETAFTAGQNVRLTFNNDVVGSSLKLTLNNLILSPAGSQALLRVLGPDYVSTTWTFSAGNGYFVELPPLNTTGTYTIEFNPLSFANGSASFSLRRLVTRGMGVDGPAVTVNLLSNQESSHTFSAVAGQNVRFALTGLTLSPAASNYATVVIYAPDNRYWYMYCYTSSTADGGCNLNLINLPLTGTYTARVIPSAGGAGSFNAQLSTVLPLPDLAISSLKLVGPVVKNANGSYTFRVTYRTTNPGGVTAVAPWYDLAFLSADSVLDNNDQTLSNFNYVQVSLSPDAGNYLYWDRTFVTSTTTTPGNYTLFVKTDANSSSAVVNTGGMPTDNGRIVESNEANNVAALAVTLP